MNLSIIDVGPSADKNLLPLRRMILRLADRCGLDLTDAASVRRFLDGDFAHCKAPEWDANACSDLHSMITLLFRLEASSSEDLGINGLCSLWHQHNEIMVGFSDREESRHGSLLGLVPA